jgi:hypothetical protein
VIIGNYILELYDDNAKELLASTFDWLDISKLISCAWSATAIFREPELWIPTGFYWIRGVLSQSAMELYPDTSTHNSTCALIHPHTIHDVFGYNSGIK